MVQGRFVPLWVPAIFPRPLNAAVVNPCTETEHLQAVVASGDDGRVASLAALFAVANTERDSSRNVSDPHP